MKNGLHHATARIVPAEYTSLSWLFMRETRLDIGGPSVSRTQYQRIMSTDYS